MITGCYMTGEEVKKRVGGFVYVRDEERKPIGIVVMDKDGKIGWSLYNEDCEDEAFTDKGLLIGLRRAIDILDPEEDLRQRIMAALEYRKLQDSRLVRVMLCVKKMKQQMKDGLTTEKLKAKA